MGRFCDEGGSTLELPQESDLGDAFPVRCCNGFKYKVREEPIIAVNEGRPGLERYALLWQKERTSSDAQ